MKKLFALRMIRETIYFYQSQILRLETLCLRTGRTKSEIIRDALETYWRFHDLKDPDLELLPGEIEGKKVPEYEEDFMRPFVQLMQEQRAKGRARDGHGRAEIAGARKNG